jgi:hypothetical protein
MAILKILLLATMPFIVAPLVSIQSHVMSVSKSSLASTASGIDLNSQPFRPHNETTIYKSRSDRLDFILRDVQESDAPLLFAPTFKASVCDSRKYLEI